MTISAFNQYRDRLLPSEKMPVLFLGHGNPMNAVEENIFVKEFRRMGKIIPKPAAILCISAHWETNGTFVTAMEKPRTIYDFYGFPRELYEVNYPASGSPILADETKKIFHNREIGLDFNWGLDHGTWTVVKHLYPNADVPIIQMSLDYNISPDDHYEIGRQLLSLRRKGVLIIGSGNIVHNLQLIAWDKMNEDNFSFDWAAEANDKIKNLIVNDDHQSLKKYSSLGKALQLAIPTPEHFLPLLYILSLKEENESVEFFNDSSVGGSVSMTSLKIDR